jgi:hypothetical protein
VSEGTCKTCPFWGPYAESNARGERVEPRLGTCRLRPPRPMPDDEPDDGGQRFTHENPEVVDFWWCSEHPARQRDRLAAMAMQADLTGCAGRGSWDFKGIAERAYVVADAMLSAREQKP